jgi:hypothetical protein
MIGSQARAHCRDLPAGVGEGGARRKPRVRRELAIGTTCRSDPRRRQRHPHVSVRIEARRHHAHDRPRLVVDVHDATDSGGIGAELLAPEAIAEHNRTVFVGVAEHAAGSGTDSQDAEKRRRDQARRPVRGRRRLANHDLIVDRDRGRFERMRGRGEIDRIGRGDRHLREIAWVISRLDEDDARGVRVDEAREVDGRHQAEYGGVSGDADGQRPDRDERHAGLAPETSPSDLQVLPERLEHPASG